MALIEYEYFSFVLLVSLCLKTAAWTQICLSCKEAPATTPLCQDTVVCRPFQPCVTVRREDVADGSVTVQRGCAYDSDILSGTLYYSPDPVTKISATFCHTTAPGGKCNSAPSNPIPHTCYRCGGPNEKPCQTPLSPHDTEVVACAPSITTCETIRTETQRVDTGSYTVNIRRGCSVVGNQVVGIVYSAPDLHTRASRAVCGSSNCNRYEAMPIPYTCHFCTGSGDTCAKSPHSTNGPVSLVACPTDSYCVTTRTTYIGSDEGHVSRGCAIDHLPVGCSRRYDLPPWFATESCVCAGTNCNHDDASGPLLPTSVPPTDEVPTTDGTMPERTTQASALTTDREPDPATCPPCPADDRLTLTCSKGVVVKPGDLHLNDIEATRVDYIGDGSFKCKAFAYELHGWLLQRAGLLDSSNGRSGQQGVTALCTGQADLEIHELDQDAVTSSSVTVQYRNTLKCREFFQDYLKQLFTTLNIH